MDLSLNITTVAYKTFHPTLQFTNHYKMLYDVLTRCLNFFLIRQKDIIFIIISGKSTYALTLLCSLTLPNQRVSSYMYPLATFAPSPKSPPTIEIQSHTTSYSGENVSLQLWNCRKKLKFLLEYLTVWITCIISNID